MPPIFGNAKDTKYFWKQSARPFTKQKRTLSPEAAKVLFLIVLPNELG